MTQELPYIFHWRNTAEREKLYGKRCKILTKGTGMRSVLVQFEDGEKHIVSARALRRVNPNEQLHLD